MKEKLDREQLSFMLKKTTKNEFIELCHKNMFNKSIVIERLIDKFMEEQSKKK